MKYKKTDRGYFLKLEMGEEIVQTLAEFAGRKKIPAAAITGIGALTDVELGYFNRETKEYQNRKFGEVYELLAINGNLGWFDRQPVAHLHCVLGDSEYNLIGGHLFSGIVAVTGEIDVQIFADKFTRKRDSNLDVNLLDF